MGIQGLFPLLKSIQKPCNLKEFSGQVIGVDAYGWLHRGAVGCAQELATGKPTKKYIQSALHRVRMLLHFGIQPYIVFDGDRLPSKAVTEQARANRRRESKLRGLDLLKQGNQSLAYQEFQKCIDITPTMARELIEELKKLNVKYVVAPYEADAQLAYLEREGYINAVLSEDSDLLIFGTKTLLTKLDQYGQCVMVRQQDFAACRDISLHGMQTADLRHMCILSGCDYLKGLPRMGLRNAHRIVRKYKTVDRIIRGIQLENKFVVPPGYLESFRLAEATFRLHWVFCPSRQQLVNLNAPDVESELDGLSCIGAFVDNEISIRISRGDVDPISKQEIHLSMPVSFNSTPRTKTPSISRKPVSLGKSKSIDHFFKPQRTPLRELDPNCFTPSTGPSPEERMRGLSAESQPRNSDVARVQEQGDLTRNHPRFSSPTLGPSKRRRLCSESGEDFRIFEDTISDPPVLSKFFKRTRTDIGDSPVSQLPPQLQAKPAHSPEKETAAVERTQNTKGEGFVGDSLGVDTINKAVPRPLQ